MFIEQARKISDKLFRDSSGNIVLGQFPNASLSIWLIATLCSRLVDGRTSIALQYLASGALFVWSFQEIFQGVNYFRRILGLVVAIYLIFSRFS